MTNQKLLASLIAISVITTCLHASDRRSFLHRSTYHALPTPPKTSSKYSWELETTGNPLLQLPENGLSLSSLQEGLTFPIDSINVLIFEPLTVDESTNAVSINIIDQHDQRSSLRLPNNNDSEPPGPRIKLKTNAGSATLLTQDGTKYIFALLPSNEYRCVAIHQFHGISIDFLYTAHDVALHTIADSFGRTATFNYSQHDLRSITQTWISGSEHLSSTWNSGLPALTESKFAHSSKRLPSNALITTYSDEMQASDKYLASIFGGPSAVAAANGFEPTGLNSSYPYYRGDVLADDGQIHKGHLSDTMHLYGSSDGTANTPLYVPLGFTSHSDQPTPIDAAVTFYYPQLGNLKDVTIAIFHVKNFALSQEGNRMKIGEIGGPGGASPTYKHSHIECYHGNTGLPAPERRSALRIRLPNVFEHPSLWSPNHTSTLQFESPTAPTRCFPKEASIPADWHNLCFTKIPRRGKCSPTEATSPL